ncbi:UNVERIFIED_CONTAM: hypothetical protein PYX00_002101 [Menopon gallinae]|uniref:Magnesium transporter NIPA2 n=1 Tax=Menopon gallinae TaxID=328185 RepID=A0AAW2IHM5_9NEOP
MLSNSSDNASEMEYHKEDINLGLTLAILSTVFIGASFIIKKKALIKINNQGSIRASAGGFSYLKEWMWWAGFISMGVGEIANFAAYAFAPASLVTPMGALSVLVSAILASRFLNEKLNLLGKLGCILCVLGSTVIVIHSPKEEEVESLELLVEKLKDSAFITYLVIVVVISLSIYYYFGPKFGHTYVSVYILLCSAVGSLTVMACKGLGIAIKESITGGVNELGNPATWLFLLAVVVCIMIQMNYLNKALDLFNTGIVTPVYYVFFTTMVIIASAILYREYECLGSNDILGNICGFCTVVIAIILLNGFKDFNITLSDIQASLRTKQKDELPVRTAGRKAYYHDEESQLPTTNQNTYGGNSSFKM